MGKSSTAANVIDLDAFRQRKQRDANAESMMMFVWFCWVPVWAPVVP